MHHDKDFAQERNGTRDIFVNTPHNAAYFERYITDWTGPTGRLGRIQFRMKDSVFPGDTMVFGGSVQKVETDDRGCGKDRPQPVAARLRQADDSLHRPRGRLHRRRRQPRGSAAAKTGTLEGREGVGPQLFTFPW